MSQVPRRVPQLLATLAILAVAMIAFSVYVGRNAGGSPGTNPTPTPSPSVRPGKSSAPFYGGLRFHRFEAGFVIQGGNPLGTGSGGPGYKFADEPVLGEYTAGAVAMANSGPNTNGSQFFICTVDDTTKLAKNYNLFGYVQTGMDVVLKIAVGDKMTSVTVQEQTS